MKRSTMIAAISAAAILGLGIFAVVHLNDASTSLSVIAVVLSLVPMYFLYSAVVLGKYDKKDKEQSENYSSRRAPKDRRSKIIKKDTNDYGKVLNFPSDKQKKNNKNH